MVFGIGSKSKGKGATCVESSPPVSPGHSPEYSSSVNYRGHSISIGGEQKSELSPGAIALTKALQNLGKLRNHLQQKGSTPLSLAYWQGAIELTEFEKGYVPRYLDSLVYSFNQDSRLRQGKDFLFKYEKISRLEDSPLLRYSAEQAIQEISRS